MTMIDFEQIYHSLKNQSPGEQKKLEVNSPISVYFGYSRNRFMRLSFLSTIRPPKLESTISLEITQGKEDDGIFWTCFDLLNPEARTVFFAFCENMIECVSGSLSENKALSQLKKRYAIWKTMFKSNSVKALPKGVLQGLYGELYFLKKYMLDHFDPKTAILSWGGPDATSKDFAVGMDWFEIKTVGASATSVLISSLTQLDSEHDGHLVILRVERMPDSYDAADSCIGKLIESIMLTINDETLESIFLAKLSSIGIDLTDENINVKFDVKSQSFYLVDKSFPRIRQSQLAIEITDVCYSLAIPALNQYLED